MLYFDRSNEFDVRIIGLDKNGNVVSKKDLKKAVSICLSCILIPAHATLTWKFLLKNMIPNTDQTSL